jgi:hypothetical protein
VDFLVCQTVGMACSIALAWTSSPVVRLWAADFYLALSQGACAGAAVFVADMLELLCMGELLLELGKPRGRARRAWCRT